MSLASHPEAECKSDPLPHNHRHSSTGIRALACSNPRHHIGMCQYMGEDQFEAKVAAVHQDVL